MGRAARSQGCRNAGRAVPGVSPGTGLCRRERTGTGFAETAGSGRVRGAGPASPSLTSRDCLRQCHPALGQDSTQQPRARRGHPEPAPVPLVRLCRGARAAGSLPPFASFPCRSFPRSCRDTLACVPLSPTALGVTEPPEAGSGVNHGGVLRGQALPCPFPPRVSALAEAEHYLPRPSQAAAPGCAPAAYL